MIMPTNKKKLRYTNKATRHARGIDNVLKSRMQLERAHWTQTCSLETIRHYALTLNNGKVIYPSQGDVYNMVTKPNKDAVAALNPASNYVKSLGPKWHKDRARVVLSQLGGN